MVRCPPFDDPKLPCSFNSSCWKRGYNPELSFDSNNIASLSSKAIPEPIPHTQHRPIAILIHEAVTPTPTPFLRRFKKANWKAFSTDVDTRICDIDPSPENYDRFVKVVHATARKHIPRGCRKNYVPGFTTDLAEQYKNTPSCTNKAPSPQPLYHGRRRTRTGADSGSAENMANSLRTLI